MKMKNFPFPIRVLKKLAWSLFAANESRLFISKRGGERAKLINSKVKLHKFPFI